MLRNGSYSAWFRTQHGEGTGIVVLNDGKVNGGDTVLAYNGSYVVDGDKFTASIATERHTQGQPSVFGNGIDNVDLTLTGKSAATTASCTGTIKQVPDMTFEAVLIPIADQPSTLPCAPTRGPASVVILNPFGIKSAEQKCPACNGTSYSVVMQPVRPGRKIYPAPCKKCGGKGRMPETAN